jgi:PAS domain S-box-containing protein
MARVLAGGAAERGVPLVCVRPDGSRVALRMTVEPLRDPAGAPAGAVAVLEGAELLEGPAQGGPRRTSPLEELLDCCPVAAYLCDPGGLITYYNQAAVRLWGRAPLRRDARDRFCGSFRLFACDGAPISHDRCWMALTLQTGEQQLEKEIVIERPDGQRLNALAHASPLRAPDGTLLGAVNVLVDITERRRVLDLLRASEQHLSAIVQTTPECVKILDAECRVLAINPAGLAMVQAEGIEEVRGRSICELVVPEHRERYRDMARRVCAGEEATLEFDVVGLKGLRRRMQTHAVPLREPGGATLHLAITRDVTEAKRAEASLMDADRRKDEFLAMLAHELRNPLAPLATSIDLLGLSPGDPELVAEVRATMKRQVDQLVRLVGDLLEVSRITRGRIELQKEPLVLNDLLGDALEVVRAEAAGRGQALAAQICSAPLRLEGDAARLRQVFLNLLDNATKYTPRGGRIELRAERSDDRAVVRVTDTGIGIAAQEMPRLFELFFQVNQSLERSEGGLGIGLTLAQRLVDLHGGTIEVSSGGLGQGSEFTVTLPASPEAAQLREASQSSHPVIAPLRILVADDNADSAEALAVLLRLAGHEVRTAQDGDEALALAKGFHPDVALLDIGMPRTNGYDLARLLRAEPWGKDILLIAETGWGQEEDRRKTREAGFHAHLVKPVDSTQLMEMLSSLRQARSRPA